MGDKPIIISDSAFFVKTIDAPIGLSSKDFEEFIDTACETLAPIPSDKIARSYVRNKDKVTIFIGMTERVFANFPQNKQATSAFIAPACALLLLSNQEDSKILFESNDSLAFVEIQNNSINDFYAIRKTSDNAVDMANLETMSRNSDIKNIRHIKLLSVQIQKKKQLCFVLEKKENESATSEEKTFSIPLKSVFSADLRDRKFVTDSNRQKRKGKLLEAAVIAIPVVFVLLLSFQILVLVKESNSNNLKELANELEPKAKLIEQQSEHAAELSAFGGAKLHTIDALAIINQARPDDILFSRTVQSSPKLLEIQGKAGSIGKIKEFTQELEKIKAISSVAVKSDASKGEARFTLNITLK